LRILANQTWYFPQITWYYYAIFPKSIYFFPKWDKSIFFAGDKDLISSQLTFGRKMESPIPNRTYEDYHKNDHQPYLRSFFFYF